MVNAIVSWYSTLEVPLQAATLSAITTFSVFFLGVWLSAWANRRNALKASRDAQKLDIYRSVLEKIDAAADAQRAASSYILGIKMTLWAQAEIAQEGMPITPPNQRFPKFSELHSRQQESFTELHKFLEQWAIVDFRFKAFRMAFGFQSNATLNAAISLNLPLMRALPADNPQGGTFPYSLPAKENIEELEKLLDRYTYESGLMGAYIADLNVELQPLLLGHLFGWQIERRDPPDPTQFTLRLDRYKSIVQHFENTEHFKRGAAMDREIREKYASLAPRSPWWRFRR